MIAEVATTNEIVCELLATYAVSGKAIERTTGTPLAGIVVYLVERNADQALRAKTHAISQADGTFVIEHLFPSEYIPTLRPYDIIDRLPIVVASADVSGVVVEVEPFGSIAGRVTREGKPVEAAQVSATSPAQFYTAVSDRTGHYEIRGLQSGEYRLHAGSTRIGAFAKGPAITLVQGEHKTGIDVAMDLAGSISGVVIDQHGKPVSGRFIAFSLLRGRDFGFATTAENGTFVAKSLSGGGEYIYEVRPDARSQFSFPPTGRKRHGPIFVRDGNTHVTNVVIQIRVEPQPSISGHVVDDAGKPVADAWVHAYNSFATQHTQRTNEAGRFTIEGLERGPYKVLATAGARTGSARGVPAGRHNVEIRLQAATTIEGILEGFTVIPDITATHSYSGRRYRVTPTNNRFRLANIPSGIYVVVASSVYGSDAQREVEVAAGTTATIALRRRGFGRIEGTLVDESRVPLGARYCRCSSTDVTETVPTSAMVTTDATGTFRCEQVLAGNQYVHCEHVGKQIRVVAGQTARLELVMKNPQPAKARRVRTGLVLEQQLADVRVSAVESGSPAERAGFAVGDVIVKLGDAPIPTSTSWVMEQLESKIGNTVTITVDRNDRALILLLTVEAAQ